MCSSDKTALTNGGCGIVCISYKWRTGVGLGHELPDAFIKGAVDEGIGTAALGTTLVAEGSPFAKNSRRIEIDVSLCAAHRSHSFAWEYTHECRP
jgi:hypothetical protein